MAAKGVLEAVDGPTTILPGIHVRGETNTVDWSKADPAQLIPYTTQLRDDDSAGEYRRQRMDKLILGVMRYGQPSLQSIAAGLGITLEDQLGYAVSTVTQWFETNEDGFRDRVMHAHSVFKGRMMFTLIDRADKGYVPRDKMRDNLPLLAALNAFVPEHFKRNGTSVQVNTGEQISNVSKTLVVVGENIAEERKALQEASD